MMEAAGCLEEVKGAEMVLVGLGEEFDVPKKIRLDERYRKGRERLKGAGLGWLVPVWNEFCSKEEDVSGELEKLANLLKDSNYFVVSVCTDSLVRTAPWKSGRLVMPCGSTDRKQCSCGCEEALYDVTTEDKDRLLEFMKNLAGGNLKELSEPYLGVCPKCGEPLVLNHAYAKHYVERGYLEQWERYRRWLQGTLNRRLVVLELGVGMRFPSVIRWPFERVAFLNQKARFYRIHETLYQLDEKLSGKGCGFSKNAIDWLSEL